MRIAADGLDATITLEDTPAAQAFAELLPLEVDMSDLNGNEKYAYLDTSLPTDASTPARIEAGDVMLYGDTCLVVFYETHDNSSYSYTRLGQVDDPAALAAAPSIRVSFEIQQEG